MNFRLRRHSAAHRSRFEAARVVFARFTPGAVETEYKAGHDPVTEADRAVDAVLRENLLRDGEGWLSEETADNPSRLEKTRVWIVDPLDGTREFVMGLPEFCVSIGLRGKWQARGWGNLQPGHQGDISSGPIRYRRALQRQARAGQPAYQSSTGR